MKMEKVKVLSKHEIQIIHSASIELLSTLGVKVDSKEARELFQKYGATIDNETNFVRIPELLVKEQLRKVPNSFRLHGPDRSYNFEVNTNNMHFSTIGTPVKIYDCSQKNEVRETILEDAIKAIRIVDSLEHIASAQDDLFPNDIPFNTLHAHLIREWAKNTRKSYGFGAYGKVVSQDIMDLTSIVVGGEEELIKRPRLIGFFNPTSPLHFPKVMTNGLSIFTKYKQPTIIAPEALAGTSAPVTLAGLLTQTNAEILSGIVLSQLYNPGAPILYGSVSHVTDMRSGNSAIGSIETGLITVGIAQLARFYNIPSRGPGAVTDSKTFDLQNGFERLQTLMLAAQAGINYITCAGTYEATLAEALELLVIDDELAGIVTRCIEGIEVNEETIALDIIKKVATDSKKGVNFLNEKHTRKYMTNELYIPKIIDRKRRESWIYKGSKDIMINAKEYVEEILKTQKRPDLSSDIESELNKCIKQMSTRSFEEYKKLEGI